MRTFRFRFSLPLVFLLATGCGSDTEAGNSPTPEEPSPPAAGKPEAGTPAGSTMVAGVHDVLCGCAIDAIGHCGNYIVVDGKHLELTGDLGLGEMEFCKKEGLKAEVEGKVVDGKFVATSFRYVQ